MLDPKAKKALDIQKQDLKLKKLAVKAEKDIEVFYEDARDIKEEEFQKAKLMKELEDLSAEGMIVEADQISVDNMQAVEKQKLL